MADYTATAAHPAEYPRPRGIDHLEVIARGGFAAVYRGWQPAFNRWVAVKFLSGQHGQSPVYRFDQEVRAVGSLSEHPHVVPVYEAGDIDGCPYLVMPYLTGGSLQQRMAAGPVALGEALATAQAVADALAEAHRLGIRHRDIKPANILFTAYGVPQLADFGVARLSDSTLTGGLLAVTVSYAAPEVLSGESASPLSDVYSLGATLYAALRGAAPFSAREGEPAVAQAMRVVHERPEPLSSFGVPVPVAEVVERSMAKDPSRRYQSATELRDALARAATAAGAATTATANAAATGATAGQNVGYAPPAAGEPSSAGQRLLPSDEPPAPQTFKRRTLAAAAAALILAGTGTAIGMSVADGPPPTVHRSSAAPPRPTSTSNTPSSSTPTTRAPASSPTTARASGSTAAGDLPPSAGGATSPAAIAPATLADTLRSYYALVDQHRLDQSWRWLSPAFQARVGQAYYRQFWGSISQVQVLSVQASGGAATITLHYVGVNGTSSTESATLGFTIGANDLILIDTDRAAQS